MFLPEEQDNVEIPGEHISVNRTVLEVLMNDSGALSDGTNYASTVIEEQVFPDYVQLKVQLMVYIPNFSFRSLKESLELW